MTPTKTLSTEEQNILLETLQKRFEKHTERHEGLNWQDVQAKLENSPEKLWPLNAPSDPGD